MCNEIKRLIEKDRLDEALNECDRRLIEDDEDTAEILRLRSHANALSGKYQNAIRDYEIIFEKNVGTIADYYQAAFHALNAFEVEKAVDWFQVVLRLSEEEKDHWFNSAAYFYLSFAHMELQNFQAANDYLDLAIACDSNITMPIPKVGMCNHLQLRDEIGHRASMAAEPKGR